MMGDKLGFLEARPSSPAKDECRKPPTVGELILIVDDDDPLRAMLARLLRTRGYSVVQAANANQARTVLTGEQPALILSDIVMPGESGIELRRAIAEKWPELPVILISGDITGGPAEFVARTPNTSFVQKTIRGRPSAGPRRTAPHRPEDRYLRPDVRPKVESELNRPPTVWSHM